MGSILDFPKALLTGSLTTIIMSLDAAGSTDFAVSSSEFAGANLGSILLG